MSAATAAAGPAAQTPNPTLSGRSSFPLAPFPSVPARERLRLRLRGRKPASAGLSHASWRCSHDHFGQHRHDASEHLVSSREARLFARAEDAANVQRGCALGSGPTCEPIEPSLLGGTELASALRRVQANRHRGTAKLIGRARFVPPEVTERVVPRARQTRERFGKRRVGDDRSLSSPRSA